MRHAASLFAMLATTLIAADALGQSTGTAPATPAAVPEASNTPPSRVLAGVRAFPDEMIAALAELGRHPDWRELAARRTQDPTYELPPALKQALDRLSALPEATLLATDFPDALAELAKLYDQTPAAAAKRLAQLRRGFQYRDRMARRAWQVALESDPVALGQYRDWLTEYSRRQLAAYPGFAVVEVVDRAYYYGSPPDENLLRYASDAPPPDALKRVLERWSAEHGMAVRDAAALRDYSEPPGLKPVRTFIAEKTTEQRRSMWRKPGQSDGAVGLLPVILQPASDQPATARLAMATMEQARLWSGPAPVTASAEPEPATIPEPPAQVEEPAPYVAQAPYGAQPPPERLDQGGDYYDQSTENVYYNDYSPYSYGYGSYTPYYAYSYPYSYSYGYPYAYTYGYPYGYSSHSYVYYYGGHFDHHDFDDHHFGHHGFDDHHFGDHGFGHHDFDDAHHGGLNHRFGGIAGLAINRQRNHAALGGVRISGHRDDGHRNISSRFFGGAVRRGTRDGSAFVGRSDSIGIRRLSGAAHEAITSSRARIPTASRRASAFQRLTPNRFSNSGVTSSSNRSSRPTLSRNTGVRRSISSSRDSSIRPLPQRTVRSSSSSRGHATIRPNTRASRPSSVRSRTARPAVRRSVTPRRNIHPSSSGVRRSSSSNVRRSTRPAARPSSARRTGPIRQSLHNLKSRIRSRTSARSSRTGSTGSRSHGKRP